MKKLFAMMLALVMVLAAVPNVALAESTAVYVSSTGKDTNAGTLDQPYATLKKAVDAAEDNAVILADKFADAVVNTGAIPKVTPRGYDTPTGTEPREIRRYEFRRGAGFPQVVISVLEMLEETNPEY